MLRLRIETYPGAKGVEIISYGGDCNDGIRLYFAVQAKTERQAIRKVESRVRYAGITWLSTDETGWTVNLEELKGEASILNDCGCIAGTVRVLPEFEPDETPTPR